jgi:hypothetical protein
MSAVMLNARPAAKGMSLVPAARFGGSGAGFRGICTHRHHRPRIVRVVPRASMRCRGCRRY